MFEERILPQISLKIDKNEQKSIYGLRHIEIIKKSSRPSKCIITLVNNDSISITKNSIGQNLEVAVANSDEAIFRGSINGYNIQYSETGDRIVVINASDFLSEMRFNQKFKEMNGKNLSQILSSAYPQFKTSGDKLLNSFKWDSLHSFQETDLDFLKRISSEIGLYYHLKANILNFYNLEPGSKKKETIKRDKSCKKIEIEVNSLPQISKIEATSWDLQTLKLLKTSKEEGKGETVRVDELHGNNKKELETYSKARIRYNRSLSNILKITVSGSGKFYPGVELEFSDNNILYNAIINNVKHTIDNEHGFLTHLSTKPPHREKRDLHLNGTLAEISNIKDPDKKGRVKVKLPSISNYETEWLPVLIPGGGKNRGLYTLPSKGDKVYITFINGDISKGVIIGGLPGDEYEGSDSYILAINKSQKIKIDRKKKSLVIENMGSKISIKDSKVELLSKENLNISAPGKVINIKGRNINFVRG